MQNIHYEKNTPALALLLAAIIEIFDISNHRFIPGNYPVGGREGDMDWIDLAGDRYR